MTKMMTGDRSQLKPVNPGAAAIDIGPALHMAAVNPDSADTPIRAFGTFTHDLHDLAPHLFRSCGSNPAVPRLSRWNPPASTGSRPLRSWSSTGWRLSL